MPKSIEIDMDKLHMKFSALNIDFGSPYLNFLGLRKSAHEGIKEWYPVKVVVGRSWPVFRENGCCLSQQALVATLSVVSTSMILKDPELPK